MNKFGAEGLYNLSNSNPNYSNATNPANSQILLNINATKLEGIQLTHNFVPSTFYNPSLSQLKMIKDAIFLNQSVSFVAGGLTIRTPGKFIFIDRLASSNLNPFDDRFLGQWLITGVKHVFTQVDYLSEVLAVKVDSFTGLFPTNETKL
jgi:hypothetical protein